MLALRPRLYIYINAIWRDPPLGREGIEIFQFALKATGALSFFKKRESYYEDMRKCGIILSAFDFIDLTITPIEKTDRAKIWDGTLILMYCRLKKYFYYSKIHIFRFCKNDRID